MREMGDRENIHLEGTVSQFFYVGPSFHTSQFSIETIHERRKRRKWRSID